MKNINRVVKSSGMCVCMVVASFFVSSCEEQLDLHPISQVEEGRFYQNAQDINQALIATYNSLHNMQQDEWALTEIRSDNTSVTPNASVARHTTVRDLDRFVVNSLNEYVENYWRSAYTTIALANDVLDNIAVVSDPTLRGQYEGEARFMRALAYFNLVRLWGGVFIVDHSVTGQEAIKKDYKRSTEAEVYEFLLQDLEQATGMLQATAAKGRVTKWAAQALWAKALLTVKGSDRVSKAETLLREVAAQGNYNLQSSYASVFDINNEYSNEILFAVRYTSGNVGLGSPFANLFGPDNSENYVVTGDGEEYNYPTEDITNTYVQNGDQTRKAASMAETWIGKNGKVNNIKYITKYLSKFAVEEDAENDWPILRYSDVLLLLAEAINENNGAPTAEAIGYLNRVHSRSVQGSEPYTAENAGNYYNFILSLAKERRLEFAFENQRWFDLLRLGLAKSVMNAHFQTEPYYNNPEQGFFSTGPIADWQLVLPIPQFEIDVNPRVTQNIGY
ncbi:RagB/SusD family nutrient uptake outer membrane protein [Pontibacter sp. E15-1]|uniref:RagB/SusD family nutrient uptake outer membrane protein n=1 Tax=Pontibacter sp. E15-1 TaxID=2919918 RepID=UPI001F50247C|nr:RagB/SusD family nutrient uptake outer membrane protein [Pontibacter sp. E15-1]MCJ8163232.1 RagB/SusD family nutrient uptake outer membrane protein [Pontibacter sp. E15-1]